MSTVIIWASSLYLMTMHLPNSQDVPRLRWIPRVPTETPDDHDTSHRGMCVYVMGLGIEAESGKHWERWSSFGRVMKRAGDFPITQIAAVERSHEDHDIPCLSRTPAGYVGMWATLQHVLERATVRCSQDWVLLFENDADFDAELFDMFYRTLIELYPRPRLVWLDARNGIHDGGSGCCTVAMAYHRKVWAQLLQDLAMHPTGPHEPFWVNYSSRPLAYPGKVQGGCETDLYLANVVKARQIPSTTIGFVHHLSMLPSEIGKH